MKKKIEPRDFIIALGVLILSAFVTYHLGTTKRAKVIIDTLIKNSPEAFLSDGRLSIFGLFTANLFATVVLLVMGLVPFLYLGFLGSVVNGGMLGFLLKLAPLQKMTVLELLVKGVLPHGVPEFLAFSLAIARSAALCRGISRKISKKNPFALGEFFKSTLIFYLQRIIPLLLVGAVVEAKVVPLLLGM